MLILADYSICAFRPDTSHLFRMVSIVATCPLCYEQGWGDRPEKSTLSLNWLPCLREINVIVLACFVFLSISMLILFYQYLMGMHITRVVLGFSNHVLSGKYMYVIIFYSVDEGDVCCDSLILKCG